MGAKMARVTGGVIVAAVLASGISPAQARPRHYDRHHHRHDDFGLGDAIGIAALLGAVAIVASSVSKDRQTARGAPDGSPPTVDDRMGDMETLPEDDGAAPPVGDAREEAANACALAARDEASGDGGYAEVRSMDEPQSIDGGFNVDGTVENRASWNARNGTTRRFTCTVQDGRVAQVYLSRDVVAR